ncbi:hypothetical protein BLNAU_19424 [Blattamonas nauphoetae]|uniref:Cpl-7 lysozyme C-terminal domain-containing protein n=1 Tax=Blattamonas nauphoetae TaxID=2049346 RepID=A0ABQ9X3V4_9EUKA|nr:hypothetical protein BLNAU_19424 [Blattamonas nauphoetae]
MNDSLPLQLSDSCSYDISSMEIDLSEGSTEKENDTLIDIHRDQSLPHDFRGQICSSVQDKTIRSAIGKTSVADESTELKEIVSDPFIQIEQLKREKSLLNEENQRLHDEVQRLHETIAEKDFYIQSLQNKLSTEQQRRMLDSDQRIVLRVVEGLYGNGQARKDKLESEGYDSAHIQQLVNEYMADVDRRLADRNSARVRAQMRNVERRKTNQEIANEVWVGIWENGAERKRLLTEKGYDYTEIQKLVTNMFI